LFTFLTHLEKFLFTLEQCAKLLLARDREHVKAGSAAILSRQRGAELGEGVSARLKQKEGAEAP